MVREIPLGGSGKVALIDDEDFAKLGGRSWHLNERGYVVNHGRRGRLRLHRVIMDCPDGLQVDHINGDRLDNRKANLRLCTCKQNVRNRRLHSNSKHGFKGVARDALRYSARICVDGVLTTVRGFLTAEEAARAYDALAIEYFGEFARLNFPDHGNKAGALGASRSGEPHQDHSEAA